MDRSPGSHRASASSKRRSEVKESSSFACRPRRCVTNPLSSALIRGLCSHRQRSRSARRVFTLRPGWSAGATDTLAWLSAAPDQETRAHSALPGALALGSQPRFWVGAIPVWSWRWPWRLPSPCSGSGSNAPSWARTCPGAAMSRTWRLPWQRALPRHVAFDVRADRGRRGGRDVDHDCRDMLPEAERTGGALTGASTVLGFLAAIFFKTLE